MTPKEIRYNLHYDDVRETFYSRHTVQHQLQYNKIKVKNDCLWKQRTHKITRLGLIESLHKQQATDHK